MFSEVVDQIILRSGRPDRQADIISWLNSTIRETQTTALYYKDLVEDQVIATSSPFIWTYPRFMRNLKTVKYGTDTYPKFVQPGKLQRDINDDYYFYAASTYYVFNGIGNPSDTYVDPVTGLSDNTISLAYYTYSPRLNYYALGSRPALFDDVNDLWTFQDGSTMPYEGTPTTQQQIWINQVYNWLIMLYPDLLIEGVLAKLFKSIKDDARAVTAYSLYRSYQADLKSNEAFEFLNTNSYGE